MHHAYALAPYNTRNGPLPLDARQGASTLDPVVSQYLAHSPFHRLDPP